MGESDVYCAFCCGPVGAYLEYGSTKPRALEKRKKRLKDKDWVSESEVEEDAWEDEGSAGGGDGDGDVDMGGVEEGKEGGEGEEEEVEEVEEGEEVVEEEEEGEEGDEDGEEDDAEDMDEEDEAGSENNENPSHPIWGPHRTANADKPSRFEESRSYNYNTLKEKELYWLNRGRCLAFNPRATGLSRTFISDVGTTDGFHDFHADSADNEDENNDDQKSCWPCYYSFNGDEDVCFPFHEKCYSLFARCMVGEKNEGEINKDALYDAMKHNTGGKYVDSLHLDYGGIEGPDQFWDCHSGEEYSVVDPGPKKGLDEVLQQLWAKRSSTISTTGTPRDLSSKVKHDPFSRLPYDIISMILPRVHLEDVTSLMKASYHMHSSLHDDAWRGLIKSKILSWFWEAENFFKDFKSSSDMNFKSAFLWLEKITRPVFGMEGPLLGIANRRRIWNACEDFSDTYWSFVPETKISNGIMDKATFSPMLAVTHPPPKSLGKPLLSQWLTSWDDADKRSGEFVTYWRPDTRKYGAGALGDFGVRFGDEERGFNHPKKSEMIAKAVPIEERDWIQELVFHIQDYFYTVTKNGHSCIAKREATYIMGVTVTMESGIEHNLCAHESIPPGLNKRVYKATPGHELIGLNAEVAKNGRLARISAIQSSRSDEDDSDDDDDPFATIQPETLLWCPNPDVPYPDPATSSPETLPVWRHPSLTIHHFARSYHQYEMPSQMTAHHMLLWAHSPAAYRNLRSLSACCVNVGVDKNYGITHEVIGFRATYLENGTLQHREIGSGGPVPAMTDRKWTDTCQQRENGREITLNPNPSPQPWDPFHLKVFEIDGENGEMITEVAVAGDVRGIRFRTSRHREWYLGQPADGMGWKASEIGEGQSVYGIVVSFGMLSGGSDEDKERKRLHGHLRVSNITAVTMVPVDEEDVR
ncbi:hypothetical protein DM02DRAFT_730513 [Periconia macrospinosa]|uniref:F-box domain-containing protein n=1 Tax=Periconia macrospinosa TaxID=97972 RepID=A0A2V1DI22_9PLEO|nr:hypothetical protein DM02DRAFT_730513 [Periconia macrospinosa]